MKLLFVGITENEQIRGIERYVIELLNCLKDLPQLNITLLCGKWQEKYYQTLVQDNLSLKFIEVSNSKIKRHLYLIRQIPKLSKNYDLVHYCNTLPIIHKNHSSTFITIHDIAEFFVKQKYSLAQKIYRKSILKTSIRNSDSIFTVSHFSKKSLIDKLKVRGEKITVTYNGIEHFSQKQEASAKSFVKYNNYFLYFGAIEHNKGILELINAFKHFKKTLNNYHLVFIGKPANALEYLNAELNDNIHYLGYQSDEAIKGYLQKAKAIVLVSHYEGFGLPALEAFIFNDNIIASNNTSLGEVTSEFAWQVNPLDVSEIASVMQQVVDNPKEFSKDKKNQILSKFSWKENARKVYESYLKLNS